LKQRLKSLQHLHGAVVIQTERLGSQRINLLVLYCGKVREQWIGINRIGIFLITGEQE
ncbi:hypothetical protein Q604_UNBC06939G0001, partial [human gut metagenome]